MRDLAQKAGGDGSLDPARIRYLSETLVERVKETDGIIKRLNLFAHSADRPQGCMEAHEALGLMIEMYRRTADMKLVKLLAESSEKSINIGTKPMFLLAALFSCLETAAESAPQGGEIRAGVVEEGPQVRFDFRWEGGRGPGPFLSLPDAGRPGGPVKSSVPGSGLEPDGPGQVPLRAARGKRLNRRCVGIEKKLILGRERWLRRRY